MANLERIYTIPFRSAFEHSRYTRGKRAVKLVQEFALRHMKAQDVRVSEGVNSAILRDGIEKPPRRLKVRMVKGDDALVRVWLIGEEEKIKAKADAKKTAVLPGKTAPIRAESANREAEEEKKKKTDEAKKPEAKPSAPAATAKPSATAPAVAAKPATPAQKPAAPATAAKK